MRKAEARWRRVRGVLAARTWERTVGSSFGDGAVRAVGRLASESEVREGSMSPWSVMPACCCWAVWPRRRMRWLDAMLEIWPVARARRMAGRRLSARGDFFEREEHRVWGLADYLARWTRCRSGLS